MKIYILCNLYIKYKINLQIIYYIFKYTKSELLPKDFRSFLQRSALVQSLEYWTLMSKVQGSIPGLEIKFSRHVFANTQTTTDDTHTRLF